MPMLFPPNRISGAEFEFEGRTYKFPVNESKTGCFVHGIMHETAFDILEACDTSIKLCYEATKENPYLMFPHEFSVVVEYAIKDEKLMQTISIQNKSNENMPVGLGFHTTFNTTDENGYKVHADVLKEFTRDEKYLPTGEFNNNSAIINELKSSFGFDTSREVSALFELGEDHLITIQTDSNTRINYLLDEKYKYLMVFNMGSGGKYVCIEPQTWISNCPNFADREKYGFSYIKPNETVLYNSSIFIDFVD